MPEREATTLRLRYGLDDGVERTCKEVGALLNLSEVRVSHLERKASERMRKVHPKKEYPPHAGEPKS